MTERYSIADARYNFPKLVHETEHGKVVELTRRGELVAMLVGRRHFEQLSSNYRGFTETYRNFAINIDMGNLDIDPGKLFSISRKDKQERKVNL